MQTRDQQYARSAFAHVWEVRDKEYKTSYGSMTHKLPVLIHSAGLAQALAFVDARSKKELDQLLTDLSQTIQYESKEKLLERSRNSELREYIRLTELVLDALLWYKRYAQSILGIEADTEEGDEK